MVPATKGTLSTIDDKIPIMPLMAKYLCGSAKLILSNDWDKMVKCPHTCNAATASKIPKKNNMLGMSILLIMDITLYLSVDKPGIFAVINSVTTQRIPKAPNMPM